MSDLFSSLSIAARSLDAHRFGLDVAGQNIANVNTPGYVRRTLDLAAQRPLDDRSAGGGVEVQGVRAQRDLLLENRLRQAQPAAGRETALADGLSIVDAAIGQPGASIDEALTRFFDAFSQVAQDPVSAVAREQAILQGQSLATAFSSMAGRFEAAQRDADARIRGAIETVNTLARRIASINESLAASGPARDTLRDEQSVALSTLADLIDIDVLQRAEGGVDVTIGNGHALVIGDNTYELTIDSDAGGWAVIMSGTPDVTDEITGGQIGGYLQLRRTLLPDYRERLDALAAGVVSQVNEHHRAGKDLNGADGLDFFVATGTDAASMQVNPLVAADSRLVVASTSGAAGDNEAAKAIANLRYTRGMNNASATLADVWGQLVYRVGADTQTARSEQASRAEIVHQIETLRDAASGVSLDEEAAMMLRFQLAYEANARFFRAVEQSLDTLMQSLGG